MRCFHKQKQTTQPVNFNKVIRIPFCIRDKVIAFLTQKEIKFSNDNSSDIDLYTISLDSNSTVQLYEYISNQLIEYYSRQVMNKVTQTYGHLTANGRSNASFLIVQALVTLSIRGEVLTWYSRHSENLFTFEQVEQISLNFFKESLPNYVSCAKHRAQDNMSVKDLLIQVLQKLPDHQRRELAFSTLNSSSPNAQFTKRSTAHCQYNANISHYESVNIPQPRHHAVVNHSIPTTSTAGIPKSAPNSKLNQCSMDNPTYPSPQLLM